MAGKIIDEDVLKLAIENIGQIIADNVYEEIPYQDSEIDDMFDATTQEIDYYSSLISDDLVSENRIFSSRHVTDLLQQLQLDCNSYADEIATRNLTTEIVSSTSEVIKENVLYLILSDSSTNTYEQYMLIGGTATPLGSTKIDLSDVYTKSEIDTKLDTKANSSEVLAVDKVQTTTGTETHDNVYSAKLTKTELDKKANDADLTTHTGDVDIHITTTERTKWDKITDKVDTADFNTLKTKVDEKVDKTSIITTKNNNATDDQIYSAKAINTELTTTIGTKANASDLTAHTGNTNVHVTSSDKAKWNGYNDTINEMKTNFQDGVNTIYNSVVAKGVTPVDKSPSSISSAIANIGEVKKEAELIYTKNSSISSYNITDTKFKKYIIFGTYTGSSWSSERKMTVSSGIGKKLIFFIHKSSEVRLCQGVYIVEKNSKEDQTTITFSYPFDMLSIVGVI